MVLSVDDVSHKFKIKGFFPFDSSRKMMSVIVKTEDRHYVMYIKGADSVMLPRMNLSTEASNQMREKSLDFARKGLRTMVFGMIKFTRANYRLFNELKKKIKSANTSQLTHLFEKLEQKITFLGLTGIEDQLQDELSETLTRLRLSGIKIWVLTGDKLETTLHVAQSCNLVRNSLQEVALFLHSSHEELNLHLEKLEAE